MVYVVSNSIFNFLTVQKYMIFLKICGLIMFGAIMVTTVEYIAEKKRKKYDN